MDYQECKHNPNLTDYLFSDVDRSPKELEEIIADADKIISDSNSDNSKLIEAYLKKAQCLQRLYKHKAQCFQRLDKHTESKEFIDRLLVLNPNMPEALVCLGNFYGENYNYDKNIEYTTQYFEKCLTLQRQ